jgi:hypothetical protein
MKVCGIRCLEIYKTILLWNLSPLYFMDYLTIPSVARLRGDEWMDKR